MRLATPITLVASVLAMGGLAADADAARDSQGLTSLGVRSRETYARKTTTPSDAAVREIAARVRQIERQAGRCRKVEFDNLDISTEGAAATAFFDGQTLRKITIWSYGESGKCVIENYFDRDALIFSTCAYAYYRTPIGINARGEQDSHWRPIVARRYAKRHYLRDGRLILWTEQAAGGKAVAKPTSGRVFDAEQKTLLDQVQYYRDQLREHMAKAKR